MVELEIVVECTRCGLATRVRADATLCEDHWHVAPGTFHNDYVFRLTRSHAEPRVRMAA